ncbi:MAG TPA: hypothetical protein VF541_12755 [Longimicrobium sp.]
MASRCAASFGASSVCTRSSVESVLAPVTASNAFDTRESRAPERSMATMVLSKVGASGRLAMAWTSASCWRIPSSSAGW